MSAYYRTVIALASVFFLAYIPNISAEPAASSVTVIEFPPNRSGANHDAMVRRAKEYVSKLPPPDTSGITAASNDGFDFWGVMTDQGPVHHTDLQNRAFGNFAVPYTTTRVQDGARAVEANNTNRLSTTYPYSAVGKLDYQDGPNSSYCTASVILRGVIVTAAHCIQFVGSGNETYTNFSFQPGHYGADGATAQQMAPYGIWKPFGAAWPTSWSDGTDPGCGDIRENDLAVMAISRDADGAFIGDIVGQLYYGWNNSYFVSSSKTGGITMGAVTALGYPQLMDSGQIMQRTDGPAFVTTGPFCEDDINIPMLFQGSNFTGGASGGPWVVNFSGRKAALSGGAVEGDMADIAIIGVTSFGSSNPNNPKDNFSPQFAQNSQFPGVDYGGYGAGNIGALVNALCNGSAPEGGTLASQGYCD